MGLILLAVAALVARYVPIPGHRTLYLVVAAPYLIAAGPLALLVLLWGHRWIMAAAAACLSVALIVLQSPWYVATPPSANAVPIRLMTINMLYGRADPQSILAIATDEADVLMVQEFTPEAAKRMAAAGIEKTFPYEVLEPRAKAMGAGIYSRYPITDTEHITGFSMPMVSARIRVDGITPDPTVVSLHLAAPWPQAVDGWNGDLDKLPGTLAALADKAGAGAVLVAGDFNSTIDMEPFRKLLTNGYDDSAKQAGVGRELTYPANERIPSFMGIDHILTRNAIGTSTRTVTVKGSDHRALLATVMVPTG
ncbi:endonuclease/exonuclease/phosphatase family protein [Mycolicibacterium sp.]|uniref:endonuclease/exonuclease/phosphatase family protein n=1 Tax=Mycolicibacterium sp. TaxID=2320850 RepID=UPI001A2229B9|nr:endonuclease/exonuclease/phosphatase family protein [Mycolicibacterium sp.]MBJ7336709.1 endonuclease/exonuclease/phosphatase family protein [Mycolicibacterium sp.]